VTGGLGQGGGLDGISGGERLEEGRDGGVMLRYFLPATSLSFESPSSAS
jgi:hypothetical protein